MIFDYKLIRIACNRDFNVILHVKLIGSLFNFTLKMEFHHLTHTDTHQLNISIDVTAASHYLLQSVY